MVKNKKVICILMSDAEQLPYTFSDDITVRRVHLDTGDYQIEGNDNFCVERKSLEDYTRSVTKDHERFFKEIKRLQSFKFGYIIVEGNLSQLRDKKYSTEIDPDYILSLTYSIMLQYSIPVLFFESRQMALYFLENMIRYLCAKKEVKTKRKYTKRADKEDVL